MAIEPPHPVDLPQLGQNNNTYPIENPVHFPRTSQTQALPSGRLGRIDPKSALNWPKCGPQIGQNRAQVGQNRPHEPVIGKNWPKNGRTIGKMSAKTGLTQRPTCAPNLATSGPKCGQVVPVFFSCLPSRRVVENFLAVAILGI